MQFLTRLPVPVKVRFTPETQAWSVVFYPWIGLLIGGLLLSIREVLDDAGVMLTSAMLLTVWVWVTGGMHLDGLADSADAWIGGQGDRERSLKIMKDPCSGPIAVAVVVLMLLLKFSALTELMGQRNLMPLLWTPVVGRSLILLLMLTTPYIRPNGLGSPLVEKLPRLPVSLTALISLILAGVMLGPWPLLVAGLALGWLRFQMVSRLGGCTGDTLGATVEMGEAAVLVACALV